MFLVRTKQLPACSIHEAAITATKTKKITIKLIRAVVVIVNDHAKLVLIFFVS